jgi:L-2,4-diaminobutyrate decarboxylase
MKSVSTDLYDVAQKVLNQLVDYVDRAQQGEGKVLSQAPYVQVAEALELETLLRKGGLKADNVEAWLKTYLLHSQHMHHPRYMGHQVSVPHLASGIADFIHGVINNPMAIYEMGPSAATIEQVVVNWMLEKAGWFDRESLHQLPHKAAGVLTHGGSLANLTALLAARAKVAPNAWKEGTPNDLAVLGSDVAHYSVMRALSIVGLGSQSLIPVKTNDMEVLDPDDLYRAYQESKSLDKRIMAVIANACATSTGLYDPIMEMGQFCKEHGLWFHVDGAHGASALITPVYQHVMKGLEYVDSMIWDMHKMLRTSTLSAAVLFRDKENMAKALSQKGSYLFHDKEEPGFDLMPYTIECTKAGIGSKLFWVLAAEGEEALGSFVEGRYAITQQFYTWLKDQADFNCPYKPESNILCFQYLPMAASNAEQLSVRNHIVKEGKFYITSTEIKGVRYLRVVIINPLTEMDDLKALVENIRHYKSK